MAIDGRTLGTEPGPRAGRDDGGIAVKVVAWLVVIVPLALLVAGTYVIGTWTEGWVGGVVSVVSTAVMVLLAWAWRRRRTSR